MGPGQKSPGPAGGDQAPPGRVDWRKSCLTLIDSFDHGRPMKNFTFRLIDLTVIALIFTAFT